MNPNIYDYATTEYAQDAFIAWMCDNFHSANRNKKYLAEKFIEFLFQTGKVPSYTDLKVDIQLSDIDVLVTLLDNSKRPIHYLIIEDKKFSQEHSNQLSKYINALLKKTSITINDISVVYYKTGHISSIDSQFTFIKSGICQNTTVPSEFNRINDVKNSFPSLHSFKICSLDDIYNFLSNLKDDILFSGSEILIYYADGINRLWNIYNSQSINILNNSKSIQWGKILEDFVANNSSKYKNLTFDIGVFFGHYWEIRFTKIVGGSCMYPVVNFRSNVFDEKSPSLKFLNGGGVLRSLSSTHIVPKPGKSALSYMTYTLPLGHFKNTSLNSISKSPSSGPINVSVLESLLDEICVEYCKILSMSSGPDFSLFSL